MTHARSFKYQPPSPGVVATARNWQFDDDLTEVKKATAIELARRMMTVVGHSVLPPHPWSLDPVRAGKVTETYHLLAPNWSYHPNLPGFAQLTYAARPEKHATFNLKAFTEAIQLLDLIKINDLPAPDVGVGDEESALSWTKGDHQVLITLEGSGEAGYSYQIDRKFQPGQERFILADRRLPDDLRDYLKAMYP